MRLWREMEKAAPGKQFVQVAHDFTCSRRAADQASQVCVDGKTQLALEQGEFTVDR